MAGLRFPVTTTFDRNGAVCGIDEHWEPSGALATANVPVGGHRDHTGVTLGYHAAGPDFALDDWKMRSTTLETLQDPFVAGSIGAGVSALVLAACAIACGLMPILCPACPAIAAGAGGIVIDEIMSLDASTFEHSDFVGFGHHVDVKPSPPFTSLFDDRRGKFSPQAGPTGTPDTLELMTFVLFDLLGWHVNFDASEGPRNYEIILPPGGSGGVGGDAHRNSVDRDATDWEPETAIHNQFTPVDNLGRFGWRASGRRRRDLGRGAAGLRPARARRRELADAHGRDRGSRPPPLRRRRRHEVRRARRVGVALAVPRDDLAGAARAFLWRQAILNWRTQTGNAKDVPVRDVVTALAALTRQKADANPAVWNPEASLAYFFGFEDQAKAVYDTASMDALQRDTVIDAIAVKLAFLVSTAEVLP
jgi:hypothetical protein